MDDLFGDVFGPSTSDTVSVKSSRQIAREEVGKYQEREPLLLGGDCLGWWKRHKAEFPLLANVAKYYLCIPGTSVPAERVFSTAGDIVNAQRSTLTSEHVDQLVFLKANLGKR